MSFEERASLRRRQSHDENGSCQLLSMRRSDKELANDHSEDAKASASQPESGHPVHDTRARRLR
jgi:hypothetical protein